MKSITIDEKTNIPLYTAIIAGASLIGAVFWVTSIFIQVNANSAEIKNIKLDQKEELKILIEIRERIIKLENK